MDNSLTKLQMLAARRDRKLKELERLLSLEEELRYLLGRGK